MLFGYTAFTWDGKKKWKLQNTASQFYIFTTLCHPVPQDSPPEESADTLCRKPGYNSLGRKKKGHIAQHANHRLSTTETYCPQGSDSWNCPPNVIREKSHLYFFLPLLT